ncbi:type II toxin-antitoxin system RelE/ParE family toxin [Oceanicaulis sp.]|uniref:type II toxin-antitoxin system RelE/ParE family toxin n=1 Tax=Oceanicaulis sp. TaxID=1924941 RepID=UPI003F6F0336
MGYRLSRAAEDDIIALYLDGIRQFGTAQADRYLTELEQAFDFLAAHPFAARERTEIDPPVRCHGHGAHIVIYLVGPPAEVLILRIRHGREDWETAPF